MRDNILRKRLEQGTPTICTRVHSIWPAIAEAVGHTGLFDYVEFEAEYAPFDLHDLDNFCRAVELYGMSAVIKIDQEPRGFLAQRAIGAGFQGVLFADSRSAQDVEACVRIVRPETPQDGGIHGVGVRRSTYMGHAGTPEYVQALRDIVVMIMVEKHSAVEQLEQVLSVPGIDMIQWGGTDYSMSIGRPGQRTEPDIKAVERRVIETALRMGVQPRAEINSVDQAKYYIDLGIRHFSIGTDISILYTFWKESGEGLRKVLSDL
ncbi:MAG: 2,4-dihydroxyhept-2-ene-1,7-dioic acid aldolase [Anaerolineae bacterium]|nr:2,4-dihydroxyhept-2-ene-1,7-dioic acid aldolase [Anaerolineae bacterium]